MRFLILSGFAIYFLLLCGCHQTADNTGSAIDREALVRRHIPNLAEADTLCPFTVGNGEFAFTMDVTGLQTFDRLYENGIPLTTQSQWGWHSVPNSDHYTLEQAVKYFTVDSRQVPYACKQNNAAGQWLRCNPHRLHLGKVGFRILKSDSTDISLTDITDIHQEADLWEGLVNSSFKIENNTIQVITACHPQLDQIAVKIKSKLLHSGRVSICFKFPCYSLQWGKNPADWNHPEKHTSEVVMRSDHTALIKRKLDADEYFVTICWEGKAHLQPGPEHSFLLAISDGNQFSFTCHFSKEKKVLPYTGADKTINTCMSFWEEFWKSGGAIDLSQCKDARAFELERRIVLSRYLTAVQCCGSLPPQESGLTCNSWFGKFHLEMHWWHAVHFALWGHPELLKKSLWWYEYILPLARHTAEQQGYAGVRWPKMVAYDGRESPSAIGVFLIWQQPHPIYYAELLYRCNPDRTLLEKYRDLVFASAEFMASFATWDANNHRYVLGPTVIPAQEIYAPESTLNPAFELSYWTMGLKTAQQWRERLGLDRVEKWDQVINDLASLPVNDGCYQNAENAMNTFSDSTQRNDHPTVLGAYGMLPNDAIDIRTMRRTLENIMQSWNWDSTWGWDFALIAMTAARVGRPKTAIDALLMDVPKNKFLYNGHNYQNNRLPVYLPGNGGLLAAVAMMAAGWDGAPDVYAPGFPQDGSWKIKFEALHSLP